MLLVLKQKTWHGIEQAIQSAFHRSTAVRLAGRVTATPWVCWSKVAASWNFYFAAVGAIAAVVCSRTGLRGQRMSAFCSWNQPWGSVAVYFVCLHVIIFTYKVCCFILAVGLGLKRPVAWSGASACAGNMCTVTLHCMLLDVRFMWVINAAHQHTVGWV